MPVLYEILVSVVFGSIRPNLIVVKVRETKYASKFGPPQAKSDSKFGPPNVDLVRPRV